MTHTANLTLVTGGTGKTGTRVAERLTALGRPVRIGSRAGHSPFNWNDASTWTDALRDVESVYVVYYPDLAFPGAAETLGSFAGAAVTAGVRRLVLLSGRGEEPARVSEQAVREAGTELTVLRSSWFAQNFSEHFLLEPVLEGVIALPAADIPEPFVDVDDVADVAVAALIDDRHVGETYELTGPRLWTFSEIAEELSRATRREIRFLPVTADEYVAAAVEQGLPLDEAEGMAELFTRVLDGRNAFVTDDVQRALGRAPRDFADYVRTTAATGVWAVPERSVR